MSEINGCPNPDCNDPECEGGRVLNGMPDFLKDMLGISKRKEKVVDIGVLTPEETKMYNEFTDLCAEAKKMVGKAETIKSLFWGSVKMRLNAHDKGHLRLDKDTGIISCVEEQ